jgi:hypothetical protein
LPQILPTHVFGGTQSALLVQVSLQANMPVALHMKGVHTWVVPPTSQLPAPSQVLASVCAELPAGQDGATH